MKLFVVDRSLAKDRSKLQFDVVWEGVVYKASKEKGGRQETSVQDDDTVDLISPFSPPKRLVRRILHACTIGLAGDSLVLIEDNSKRALIKTMGQAFLSGFCDGYREQDLRHTAAAVFQATATSVSDDAITPILKYYKGDPTELVRLLSRLLSHIRVEGFVNGWRIFIADTGGQEPDTRQWLMTQQDFTPVDPIKDTPIQPQHGIDAKKEVERSTWPRNRLCCGAYFSS